MGSSSSKDAGTRVSHSSCLGRPSPSPDRLLLDHRNKETQHFPPQAEEEEEEDDDDDVEDEEEEDNEILKQQRHFCGDDPTATTSSTPPPPSTRLRSRFNFSFTKLTRSATFRSSSTSSSSSSLFHPLPPLSVPPPPALSLHPHTSPALSPHLTNHHVPIINHHHQPHHISTREPVQTSVRFSRTLSVGRLRDRVLRTSSFTDGLFRRLQQPTHPASTQITTNHVSPSTHQLPPVPIPMYNSISNTQHHQLETSRPREPRYHDIMEHRTDFLERRRRIRSQVRALQRLGSRFENLSGHERSCILAGQHRSGHCTCRMSSRTRNPDDDTSARASISRIVMLAEALFEVLDEIHQQSVVLSSRASVSSLGSIPAPKEVVESMPVKIYTKLQKHQLEEVAQCYICLVEYEEGDSVRILPCHHEFHKTCIDKWLKEIHRVCPLCRGDVCKSESLSSEN